MKEKNTRHFALIVPMLCLCSMDIKAQVFVNLNIDQPPSLTASAGTDQTICFGENTSIEGTVTGGTSPYTYAWSPSTGLSSTTAASPAASPVATTTYFLTVKDANNCNSIDSVKVIVNTCNTGINTAEDKAETANFRIIPNPNQGSFSVIWSSFDGAGQADPVKLELYNFLGKRIYETSFNFPLSGVQQLSPFGGDGGIQGLYLIKILYNNSTSVKKLIIK